MELLRITRQIHCKAVEQRATLIHRQYNRDWGTSYSRPPVDPYLTFPLLQNPGGATALDPVNKYQLSQMDPWTSAHRGKKLKSGNMQKRASLILGDIQISLQSE